MNLEEIVKTARAANGSAFGNIKDERAVKILRAAFEQVGNEVDSAKDGKVMIGGLGRFTIKNVERDKDGVKVTKRRVTFRRRGAGKGRKAK
jgi:hypothetical protein